MTVVRLSERAERQLDAILDYLELNVGPLVASQHEDGFNDLFERLKDTPKIGANRSELGQGVKLSMVTRYLVFHCYHAEIDEVEVITIRDGSRRELGPSNFS